MDTATAEVPKEDGRPPANPRIDSLNYILDIMHKKLMRQFRVNLFYKNALRFPEWNLQAHEIEALHKSFSEEIDTDLREYRNLLFAKFHVTERLRDLQSNLVRVSGPAWRPSGSAKQDFLARSIAMKQEYVRQLTEAINAADEELKHEKAQREVALSSLNTALELIEQERVALDQLALEAKSVAEMCESRCAAVISSERKRDLLETVRGFDETDFRNIQM